MEINTADYHTLLRVPGIGPQTAWRIVGARKHRSLGFEELKAMRVVLKRAQYFITCRGKMMYHFSMDQDYILRNLLDYRERSPVDPALTYRQLSLFDDCNFGGTKKAESDCLALLS